MFALTLIMKMEIQNIAHVFIFNGYLFWVSAMSFTFHFHTKKENESAVHVFRFSLKRALSGCSSE